MDEECFVLAEIDNLSPVFAPLKSTQRIKYTCYCVSQSFLIFGATSGGLYIFRREPCIFLQLLPNKDGTVSQVSVSPDEKLFAFATFKGAVCILERSHDLKVRRVLTSVEHQGSEVTALHWNAAGSELYIGDDTGKISVMTVSAFMAKSMFQTSTFILMQLDSRIVQLDWFSGLLLVSTFSRSYICDTMKEQYRQIGHKLREGEYGACFYAAGENLNLPSRSEQKDFTLGSSFSSLNEGEKLMGYEGVQNLKIYCSRPGSRLWEVHIDGTVLSTHQFKQAFAVSPTEIIRSREGQFNQEVSESVAVSRMSFNFTKLFTVAKKFLFTYKRDGFCILDPCKGNVVLWNNSLKDIVDAKTVNDVIYFWTASGTIHAVAILPLDRFLVRLYLRKQYALCAQLCDQHNNYLLELAPKSSKLQILADLGTKLDNKELAERISPFLAEAAKYTQERQSSQKLKCGIFLVGNTQFLWNENEIQKQQSLKVQPLVPGHIEKSRSLSASPESRRRKRNEISQPYKKTASTTSLPELEYNLTSMENSVHTSNATVTVQNCASNVHVNQELKSNKSNDSLHSLDAIPVFKELKHSVSWKSLKEKWQMLEGKMKLLSHEITLEPLDVRTSDYQEAILEEKSIREDFELVHSSKEKMKKRASNFPVLDVTEIIELSKSLSSLEENKMNRSDLVHKLLNNIYKLYELFLTALIKNHCGAEDNENVQNPELYILNNLKHELNIIGTFPFSHYFTVDVVKIIRNEFHRSLKTNALIEWLRSRVKDVQNVDQFPDHFRDVCSDDALKLDFLLSRILVIFSEILDPRVTIQFIYSSQLHCYFLTLCVILDRYQEGNLFYNAESNSEDANCEELPVPLLLNTLFFMFSMEQIETCCNLGIRVSVRDVWYVIMRLQQQLELKRNSKDKAQSHCYSLFLTYLEKMSSDSDYLLKVLTDDQLRKYVISAFEELNSEPHRSCMCGFPLLSPPIMSHPELAEAIVQYYWDRDRDYLIKLCKSVPSLWHMILPLKQHESITSVLPVIIHLDHKVEFVKWIPKMDQSTWEYALDIFTKFRTGICLNCGSSFSLSQDQVEGITWSFLGPLIVKSLGPHVTVQLLTKYVSHIGPGELDARFFQSCIYSAIIDNHAKGLRNEVVDMLNEYTKKATEIALFSPVVGSSIAEALKEDLGKSAEFPVASENHYWGVKVNMTEGNCPCCALPLGSPVLMKDGGVTTFRCGHSFHVVCLKRQLQHHTCPICTRNS